MKVLIVEDDPVVRALLKRVIGSLAERVYECSDRREAVKAYAENRPDWVLMDIRMKGGDGLAATLEITSNWPEARVIIVTSYNEASLREAALQAGARGYVLKENLSELVPLLEARDHSL